MSKLTDGRHLALANPVEIKKLSHSKFFCEVVDCSNRATYGWFLGLSKEYTYVCNTHHDDAKTWSNHFRNEVASPQPPPKQGNARILDLVLVDLVKRAEDGKVKYGTYLQAHNGRDALIDLYQELLDACMYIRQLIEEGKDEKDM